MCGICGLINFDNRPVLSEEIQTMMDKMNHRGPDDKGLFIDNNVGLGHLRLSIIDLSSAGRQPMFSNDGRYCIVHNGEVYNYLELKDELSSKYEFRTKTDTEVILNSYCEWGEECLNKFNGMFAFVIYDCLEKSIFIARDRYGIKPLYYYKDKNRFMFASEIKAILPLLFSVNPNEKIIFEYLIYNRIDQSDETFFKNIHKLQHGHYITMTSNRLSMKRWYRLRENLKKSSIDFKDYKDTLASSIQLRLRSDVPVGVCLSGGLDSSSIVSILLKDFHINNLCTFSAVYGENESVDESQYIKIFSSLLENMYYTYPTADTLYYDLEKFITAHNEPVPTLGPYAQFKVMELAKGKVVVTLDGQGSDEQLAGYHYFFGGYFKELIKTAKLYRFFSEVLFYFAKHKSTSAIKYLLFYFLPLEYKNKIGSKIYGSVNKDFFNRMSSVSKVGENLYNPNTLNESLLQHFEYKLEHLLKWEDLNGMCHSLEPRVPFLDHRFVEMTLSLPSNKIINNGSTKYILRKSLEGTLPEQIRTRQDKNGFDTPSDDWFRTKKFKEIVLATLNSYSLKNRGLFETKDCIKRYKQHLNGNINISKDIWKWINLEKWFNIFID